MPFGFFSFKATKNIAIVREWMKLQTYDQDAIYYLIQKEIYENGMRDLSYVIPRLRNDAYFEATLVKPLSAVQTSPSIEELVEAKDAPTPQGRSSERSSRSHYVSKQNQANTIIPKPKLGISPVFSSELSSDTTCYDD